MDILTILFWVFTLLIGYSYFGYPIFLMLFSRLFGAKNNNTVPYNYPKVDILIAAYNEDKVIKYKIENSLKLDYPEELMNIWIASDGSSDNTNKIVKEIAAKEENVHLLEYPRTGKSGVINMALSELRGDIVVFSDANTMYDSQAIKLLINNFSNEKVGCVCGKLVYQNPDALISGEGESFYWKYETSLKILESKVGYIAGANGAIYSIRRSLFEPLPANTINDDFTISMRIVQKGYRSLYEENAAAYEDVAPNMESEFRRHVRDGAGHYIAITHLIGLLNPLLGIKSFIYWSHRIIRWLVPFLLICLFAINFLLSGLNMYKMFFFIQIGFYILAILGFLSVILGKRLYFFLYIPFYFCNLNLALFLGFVKAITNKQKPTWERTDRT